MSIKNYEEKWNFLKNRMGNLASSRNIFAQTIGESMRLLMIEIEITDNLEDLLHE